MSVYSIDSYARIEICQIGFVDKDAVQMLTGVAEKVSAFDRSITPPRRPDPWSEHSLMEAFLKLPQAPMNRNHIAFLPDRIPRSQLCDAVIGELCRETHFTLSDSNNL